MTSKLLFVAAIAGAMMGAQGAYADPPDQSAAVRGANMHYVYHRGWHRVDENMPVGERAGAASYPRTMPAHWEIPAPNSEPFKGDAMMPYYKEKHAHSEINFPVASTKAYTGEFLLPAGTWTGEPLPPPDFQQVTWQKSVNGTYRKDEIAGQAMVIQKTTTVTTTHTVVAPPSRNPQVVE
jgi:hypothetical protein